MKTPSLADSVVKVSAYLTDLDFGYTHWHAAQFMAPRLDRFGLLQLFESESERDEALRRIVSQQPEPW